MVLKYLRRYKLFRSNWKIGLLFSAIFVTLLVTSSITDSITDDITDNVIDELVAGCSVTFADRPVNLENCLVKTEEARSFKEFNVKMCSGCGEEQSCLVGDDLIFCENGIKKNQALITLRSGLKQMTDFFDSLSTNSILIWIASLFSLGWLFGRFILKNS